MCFRLHRVPTLEAGRRKYIFTQMLWSLHGLCDLVLLLPFYNGVTGGAEEARGFPAGCFVPLTCLCSFVVVFVSRFLWRLWVCSPNQPVSWRGPGLPGVVGLYDNSPVHSFLHGLLSLKYCSSFFFPLSLFHFNSEPLFLFFSVFLFFCSFLFM